MLHHLRPALVLFVALTAITGLAYPLAMTGLAGLAFPSQAAGSIVLRDGKPVGSSLIGQAFAGARYFQGRPSATTGWSSRGTTPRTAGSSPAASGCTAGIRSASPCCSPTEHRGAPRPTHCRWVP